MAVGWHAVRRGEVGKGDVAIVIGCGPIGLAVICMLKAHGVRTVIASDFSPGRRALASACGADVVVDPAQESPYTAAAGQGIWRASSTRSSSRSARSKSCRAADALVARVARRRGGGRRNAQAPGDLRMRRRARHDRRHHRGAPLFSRVVVVGVCMGADHIRPAMAINKEIDLRFVIGYTPLEFRDTLHMLADGKVNAAPLITGTVGLAGVEAAFDALGDPEAHAKILIDPKSDAASPLPVG